MAGTNTQYERTDANPRLVAYLAIGIGAFLVATPLILLVLYPRAELHDAGARIRPIPPAPRLQIAPADDLLTLRHEERKMLTGYGWIDKAAGIVRIPIDRAMALTAQRGIADWNLNTPDPQIPPRAPQR